MVDECPFEGWGVGGGLHFFIFYFLFLVDRFHIFFLLSGFYRVSSLKVSSMYFRKTKAAAAASKENDSEIESGG